MSTPQAGNPIKFSRRSTLTLAILACLFVAAIILYPDNAFQSSLQALKLWWSFVFPALLPFFVLTELALGLGALHGLAALLEPLARPLLRLPGTGVWALVAGSIGGFPTGAKAAAEFRKRGILSQKEGERLLALSFFASPALVVIVIAAAWLHNSALGILLGAVHIVAGVAAGTIASSRIPSKAIGSDGSDPSFSNATAVRIRLISPLLAMQEARHRDGRTFGKLLGDAVAISAQNLMVIGGYIIMFAVLLQAIRLTGFGEALGSMLAVLWPGETGARLAAALQPFIAGLFEPHLGAYAWSAAAGLPDLWQAAGIAALLGWGGFSAHAQVRALTQETDLRYGPFLRARLLHGGLALLLTVALWRPFTNLGLGTSRPSFLPADAAGSAAAPAAGTHGLWPHVPGMLAALALALALLILAALLIRALQALTRRRE